MTVLYWVVHAACLCIAAGGVVFYALVLVAARRYRREIPLPGDFTPPITILKALVGTDATLEENLRTFFELDYPQYQILFAVREESDPAVAVVRRLLEQHPGQEAELMVTGEPEFPNPKVYSLTRMAERARYGILVVSDSGVWATPGYLRGIAADFADPRVGVASCPYRTVPGRGFWSRLEALTVNTEFWCGVLVAWRLEGMRFALGPTMSLRREYLDKVGGFAAAKEYLAEDFVLGRWAREHGYKATLSKHVVDRSIGSHPFRANLKHRIRWARSTRRSRPWGYVGQIFTNPLPFALVLLAGPSAPFAAVVFVARAAVGAVVASGLLGDPLVRRYWWLAPVADVISLAVWVWGFFGDTVEWRGRRYQLFRDGRFRLEKGPDRSGAASR